MALGRTHPGPVPGTRPPVRRAYVYQVVEVGGWRDELGAHKRVLQHLPASRGSVESRAANLAPPLRAESPAHQPQQHHTCAPALLLSQLIRHPEEESALALGAEQLASAVVSEVGNVKLVLLCGKTRELGRSSHVPASGCRSSHSCTGECTQTWAGTHSLTCQWVPEVGQADLLGAVEEQRALWIQGSYLRGKPEVRPRYPPHPTCVWGRPSPS